MLIFKVSACLLNKTNLATFSSLGCYATLIGS